MRCNVEPIYIEEGMSQENLRGHPEVLVLELELMQAQVHDTVEF